MKRDGRCDRAAWRSPRPRQCLIGWLTLSCALGSISTGWAQEQRVVWELNGGGWVGGIRELPSGTLLITEKVRNRVVEIVPTRPSGGRAVWVYQGFAWPDYARRLPNGNTLIADTGHHQVIEVAPDGRVASELGDGGIGCLDSQLRQPSDALLAESGNLLVVDQTHSRILELNRARAKVWSYGDIACAPGPLDGGLRQPTHVETFPGGDLLVVDYGLHVVRRVTPTPPRGAVVRWEYGTPGIEGPDAGLLRAPVRARIVDGGNVLIADALNHRVVEIEPTDGRGGRIVWQYGVTGYPGSGAGYLDTPYDAERRANGNTLIAEMGNGRVIEIAPLSLKLAAPAGTVELQSCTGLFSLQILDTYGDRQAAANPVIVELQSSGAGLEFSLNSSCSELVNSVMIPSGASEVSFYVRASVPGPHSVIATAAGYGGGRLEFDVPAPPSKLRIGCECSGASLSGLWLCSLVAIAWKRRHAAHP